MKTVKSEKIGRGELILSQPTHDALLLGLSGSWKIGNVLSSSDEVLSKMKASPTIRRIAFDTQNLSGWDSGLLTFLLKVVNECSQNNILVEKDGLPQGVRKLFDLATTVPEKKGVRRETAGEPFFSRVGEQVLNFFQSLNEMLAFIGEVFLAFLKLLRGKARFRISDLTLFIQQGGAQALPIVALISALVGLILAFIGAIQLRLFGAGIYVADLVAIGMLRAMGAIMVGIILAGRTGAAYAAELGTMQVNEELDSLQSLGISPMEFLVLPRVLALTLMMPLLCLYADLMGILGGMFVGVSMLDISVMEYYHETCKAATLNDFWVGLFSSLVFGILVSLSGCLRGMECGRSASDVGNAATSAVVTGIVSIIVAMGIITFVCEVIRI